MRFLALIFLLLLSAPVAAKDSPDRASILMGSKHIGATGFEERNPGLFLTWEDRGGLDWSAGVYANSYGRVSVAAVAALPVIEWRSGAVSLFAGLAHYPGDGRRMALSVGDVVPLAGVQIRQGHAFAQIVPMDGRPVDALISFGLTWGLGR